MAAQVKRGRRERPEEAAGAPLRPLALVWAAFGILPWAAATLMWPSDPLGKAFTIVEVAAFLALLLVVKDRVPVRRPRLTTGASLLLFLLAVVRFGVLPFASEQVLSGAGDLAARHAGVARILAFTAFLGLAFVVTSVVVLVSCALALWRRRRSA